MNYLRFSISLSLFLLLGLLIISRLVLARYRMNARLYDPIARPITVVCTPVDYALAVHAHRGKRYRYVPLSDNRDLTLP